MNIKSIANSVTNSLLKDDFRQSFLVVVLSGLLSIIASINIVVHFVNDEEYTFAIICTAAFVLALAVFFLTLFVNKYQMIWRRIFMGGIILFFSYLCYDGGPDGFLHLWILLIPAFSFITFGIYEGFITSVPVFLSMIAFFWWPLADYRKYAADQAAFNLIDGTQVATFSENFRLRFVFIYIVFLLLGFFAELVRRVVAVRLKNATDHFEYVSLHDSLTGLANQNYLERYLEEIYIKECRHAFYFVILDNLNFAHSELSPLLFSFSV